MTSPPSWVCESAAPNDRQGDATVHGFVSNPLIETAERGLRANAAGQRGRMAKRRNSFFGMTRKITRRCRLNQLLAIFFVLLTRRNFMRRMLFVSLSFLAVNAFALNNRSAVSVNGSDLNPCTTTSPCRSFGAALAQTNPGGEVIALDSGGYGSFTAAQAVTVSGAPGFHAAITAPAGNGITVSAGPADAVFLRNLVIIGAGGSNGIDVQSAASVHIVNCLVRGFTSGSGVFIEGPGAETEIDHLFAQGNATGVGINAAALTRDRITNSQIDDNMT